MFPFFLTPALPPRLEQDCREAERQRQEARAERFRAMIEMGLRPSEPPKKPNEKDGTP